MPCSGVHVELFAFDTAYVERLRAGDPLTEKHFVAYFEQLVQMKLRTRMMASDEAEEGLIRVLATLRKQGGVRKPESFGAFVNSICNNVLSEYHRSTAKTQSIVDSRLQIPDKVLDLEGMLVTEQSSELVRQILEEMPARDRELLRAIFLDERDKDDVCQEFKVDRNYLRVLLHRAKDKFKVLYKKEQIQAARGAVGPSNP